MEPNLSFFVCVIELFPPEELLKLLKENPTLYTKCTLHIDTSGRQRRYYGQLPTPDSPDIRILGPVRQVYEDDLVVLQDQEEEINGVGYQKGEHNFTFSCFQSKTFYLLFKNNPNLTIVFLRL